MRDVFILISWILILTGIVAIDQADDYYPLEVLGGVLVAAGWLTATRERS